jgi:predicted nucleic acid-binding Zn ribbon protein
MKSVFENLAVRKKRTAPEATETVSHNSVQSVNQMSSGEYEAALRSNRSLRQQIDGSAAVRHVDLSKPTNNERYVVLRPCAGCGKDVAVSPEHKGAAFCSNDCQKSMQMADDRVRATLIQFADLTPGFYKCPYNTTQLVKAWQEQTFEWNVRNLRAVFVRLRDEGKMLLNITMKDIQKMSPEEYDTRLRLDPDLGGHKKAIEDSARPVESAKPSFEPGGRLAPLQRAAENARKAQSANYANRYSGATSYVNGVPTNAPSTLEQSVVFRNGRRAS